MTTVKEPAPGRYFRSLTKPENAFLLLGTLFGLLMVFITPPALVGDEPNHFFRAYQISDGVIVGTRIDDLSGGWIPQSVLFTNRNLVGEIEMNHAVKFDTNLISELRQIPLNEEEKVFVPFHNTVVYSPIPYIPQVIGILIGKSFGASALALIYWARVVNLIFFMTLAYFSIRVTPLHKWTFAFLWLTPTTVFQAASASVDAFTFGICFLLIAYFLYYALGPPAKIGLADIVAVFVVCLKAVLSKHAYVMLPMLFLIIPRRKLSPNVLYCLVFISLMAACVGAVGWWSAIVKPIFLPYRGDVFVSPDEQLALVLADPVNFLKIAITSYVNLSRYYFVTFFGQLTWLDLFVPKWLTVYLFLILTSFALLEKSSAVRLSKLNRSVFLAVLAGTAVIISLLLYLSWSPVGGDRVAGIQGRYFIPVAPLFFLLFANRRIRWRFAERHTSAIFYFAVTVSLSITLNSILQRYYF